MRENKFKKRERGKEEKITISLFASRICVDYFVYAVKNQAYVWRMLKRCLFSVCQWVDERYAKNQVKRKKKFQCITPQVESRILWISISLKWMSALLQQ